MKIKTVSAQKQAKIARKTNAKMLQEQGRHTQDLRCRPAPQFSLDFYIFQDFHRYIPESEREKSNKDLVDNYLTSEGNFSFVVYDENDQELDVISYCMFYNQIGNREDEDIEIISEGWEALEKVA